MPLVMVDHESGVENLYALNHLLSSLHAVYPVIMVTLQHPWTSPSTSSRLTDCTA